MKTLRILFWAAAMTFLPAIKFCAADEGMWLFNNLPKDYLQSKYGFEPTKEWANHVMKASVRFNSGGSASFVSANGLVLTNHHVGADTLHKLSTKENNYYENGFYAATPADEKKAPDLELNQLVSIEDVTQRVNRVVKPSMSATEAFRARRAVMEKIEKESLDKTKLRSDVVILYGGAQYHLYRYKKYTDVRLVWAPESAIAFFGGDADNFEYPRYCLDVCLFRVYENNKPAKIEHYLKVAPQGVRDDELVFVSGNPGRTQRIFTTAALKHQRDYRMPYVLNILRRWEILFQQFGLESEEKKRRAKDELFSIQNARKAYMGMLRGLQDPSFIAKKEAEEEEMLRQVRADPKLRKLASAWQKIEETQQRRAELQGKSPALRSQLYQIAEELAFMAVEDQKPSSERLREYRDSARESLQQQLFSPAPIYNDLEQAKLADALQLLAEKRGGSDPLVLAALAGKGPVERAGELVSGTKLADVEARKKLADGGLKAMEQSSDPLIQLARELAPETRRVREELEALEEIERQAYAKITEAKFALQGASTYPDATFTLRLAFGQVKGYREDGHQIPPWTTIGGAFEHEKQHGAVKPWKLPKSWHQNKAKLDLSTPINFVCTADIIGGNSGSPVINRKAELVGVIFDGNIQSLTADYAYSDRVARAVSVDVQAVREALDKIYQAKRIVDELKGGAK